MATLPLVEPSPRDRCTFRRPFAPDFHECPAFEASEYRVSDSRGYSLGAIITCAHLAAGLMARFGSSYPRCDIGSPAERAEFAAERSAPTAS
jgi:hypothetical protein